MVTQLDQELYLDLQMANNNVQTLTATLRLPQLDRISISGVSNAMLQDFNQQHLLVNISGVSRLSGESLSIHELVAVVSGVSQLDLGQAEPMADVNIDLSGVSRASLNMDVSATLTGEIQGTSAILYYGTDVANNLEASTLASVSWLGETRN